MAEAGSLYLLFFILFLPCSRPHQAPACQSRYDVARRHRAVAPVVGDPAVGVGHEATAGSAVEGDEDRLGLVEQCRSARAVLGVAGVRNAVTELVDAVERRKGRA